MGVRYLGTLAAAAAAAVLALTPASAQSPPREDDKPVPADAQKPRRGDEMGLRSVVGEVKATPALVEAAKTRPAPPAELRALMPEKLAGLPRTALDAKIETLGPASASSLRADYASPGGTRKLTVQFHDRAGLTVDLTGRHELPEPGSVSRNGAVITEGIALGGYRGVVIHAQPGLTVVLQLAIGERGLLDVSGNLPVRELLAAVEQLDLDRLGELCGAGESR